MAPLALLAGRLEPRGLQLVRPHLALQGSVATLLPALLRGLTRGELADIGRVQIVDGMLVHGGGKGRLPPVDAVDLRGKRDAMGVFQLDLAAAVAGDPVRLTLKGEPLAPDVPMHLEVRLEAGPRASPATLEFAGQLVPEPAGLAATGALHLNTERGPLPPWLGSAVAAQVPAMDLRARRAAGNRGSSWATSNSPLATGDCGGFRADRCPGMDIRSQASKVPR